MPNWATKDVYKRQDYCPLSFWNCFLCGFYHCNNSLRIWVDRSLGRVVKGYGILAPRVDVDLRSAGQTDFSRIMAGLGGVTAYDTLVGDFYQDLFGEGIFAGKGLLDVDAFYEVLNHALPENQVLSHDILEGGFLRTAFVSDLSLIHIYNL